MTSGNQQLSIHTDLPGDSAPGIKILLIQPPLIRSDDAHELIAMDDAFNTVVAMGLQYIAAMLLDNNFEVLLLNQTTTPWQEAIRQVHDFQPDLIGITSLTHDRYSVMELVDTLKEQLPSTKIALGGVHASCVATLILRKHPSVDYIAISEAETSFLELARRIGAGESTASIKGILQRKPGIDYQKKPSPVIPLEGGACANPYADFDWVGRAEPIEELGDLPIPARYFKYVNVSTARGCPFNCSFCNSLQVWGRKVRYRPIDNVIEELTLLRDNHGVKLVNFKDETFTMHRKRVIELCKAIIDAKLQILWTCDTRVDCLDEERLYWMRKAGCIYMSFGVESGSERILKQLDKKTDMAKVRESTALARKFGILVRFYMMLNLPHETEQDRQASIDIIEECGPHYSSLSVLGILPGTDIFTQYCEENNQDDNIWFEDQRDFIPYTEDMSWRETPTGQKLLSFGKVNPLTGYTDINAAYTEAELRDIQTRLSDCFIGNYDLAIHLSAQQEYADAIHYFQLALEIWPDYTKAKIELGLCRLYSDDTEEPEDLFATLIEDTQEGANEDPETWFKLGIVAKNKLCDYPQAEICFRKVLILRANHVLTINHLRQVLSWQGKKQEILDEILKEARAEVPQRLIA